MGGLRAPPGLVVLAPREPGVRPPALWPVPPPEDVAAVVDPLETDLAGVIAALEEVQCGGE